MLSPTCTDGFYGINICLIGKNGDGGDIRCFHVTEHNVCFLKSTQNRGGGSTANQFFLKVT